MFIISLYYDYLLKTNSSMVFTYALFISPFCIHADWNFENEVESVYQTSIGDSDYEMPSCAYNNCNITHFNLEYTIQALLKIQDTTLLEDCAQAYMECENNMMQHSVDLYGRPVAITIPYERLFQDAKAIVHKHHPQIPLTVFDKLLPYVNAQYSARLSSYPTRSYRFSFPYADWTGDKEDFHYFAPQENMNGTMVKGALIVLAGGLATKIPWYGSYASGYIITYGLSTIYTGWTELQESKAQRLQEIQKKQPQEIVRKRRQRRR